VTSGKSTKYLERLDSLEETLSDVKTLYHSHFGSDVDQFDASAEVIHQELDADCATWVVTSAKQNDGEEDQDSWQKAKVMELERSLNTVKVLYEQNYGQTVDDDVPQAHSKNEQMLQRLHFKLAEVRSLYDKKYSYEEKVEALEESVSEVMLLFQNKHGCSVDMDVDGALWIKSEETAEPQDAYSRRFAGLESRLAEVKILYDDTHSLDEKVESLEESVNDVKRLFEQKFGYSVDDELEDQSDQQVTDLESMLADVKALYEEKFSYEEKLQALEYVLADVKTLYNEKLSYEEKLQVLEASVSDVQGMFEQKYGCDGDD